MPFPLHLFTYGTLMSEALMFELTGAQFYSVPYELKGFDQRQVIGEAYPAAFRAPDARLPGRLYQNLNSVHFEHLDAYEGPLYERIEVECVDPFVTAGATAARIAIYLVRTQHQDCLAAGRWRPN